jgi:hypothetical protein
MTNGQSFLGWHLQKRNHMINLRNAVYYETVDDITVDIFDKYKWGLKYLGIIFSQKLLDTIVYCSNDLESTLKAFCAWALWLKIDKKETIKSDILEETLIRSLQDGWQPSDFQEDFIAKHSYIFKSPQELIWEKAGDILGKQERNFVIADILENGELKFRDSANFKNGKKIDELKTYIASLFDY